MKFLIECVAPFVVGCAPLSGFGHHKTPQQCSPHSGVSLGCWGPPCSPQSPERAGGTGAEGSPRAGGQEAGKLQLRLIAGFQELLCLQNACVSWRNQFIRFGYGQVDRSQSRRWRTDTVSAFDRHAGKESLNRGGGL